MWPPSLTDANTGITNEEAIAPAVAEQETDPSNERDKEGVKIDNTAP